MMIASRQCVVVLLAILVATMAPTPAHANAFVTFLVFIYLLDASTSAIFLLASSVAAGILERPFVARAGVRESVIWYSLQANLVNLITGFLAAPFLVFVGYLLGPLWLGVALVVSILSKGFYLQWRAVATPEKIRWRWIVIGNIVSSAVVLLLPIIALWIREEYPLLQWKYHRFKGSLAEIGVVGSVGAFGLAFLMPAILRARKQRPAPVPQSPDERVSPPDAG